MSILKEVYDESQKKVFSLGLSPAETARILPALTRWQMRKIKPSQFAQLSEAARETVLGLKSPFNTEGELIQNLVDGLQLFSSTQVGGYESGDTFAALMLAINFASFGEMEEGIGRRLLSRLCGTVMDVDPEDELGTAIWVVLANLAQFKTIQIKCEASGNLIAMIEGMGHVIICPDSVRAQSGFSLERLWELGQAGRYRAYFGSEKVIQQYPCAVCLDYPLTICGSLKSWDCFLGRLAPLLPENPIRRSWLEESGTLVKSML